jgi:hypothetical protein
MFDFMNSESISEINGKLDWSFLFSGKIPFLEIVIFRDIDVNRFEKIFFNFRERNYFGIIEMILLLIILFFRVDLIKFILAHFKKTESLFIFYKIIFYIFFLLNRK